MIYFQFFKIYLVEFIIYYLCPKQITVFQVLLECRSSKGVSLGCAIYLSPYIPVKRITLNIYPSYNKMTAVVGTIDYVLEIKSGGF